MVRQPWNFQAKILKTHCKRNFRKLGDFPQKSPGNPANPNREKPSQNIPKSFKNQWFESTALLFMVQILNHNVHTPRPLRDCTWRRWTLRRGNLRVSPPNMADFLDWSNGKRCEAENWGGERPYHCERCGGGGGGGGGRCAEHGGGEHREKSRQWTTWPLCTRWTLCSHTTLCTWPLCTVVQDILT